MPLRRFFFGSLFLFLAIFAVGIAKKARLKNSSPDKISSPDAIQAPAVPTPTSPPSSADLLKQRALDISRWPLSCELLPGDVDRIGEFFDLNGDALPIVETIRYSPNVSWSPHKLAWLADYAAHFCTSKHFISRSLAKGQPQYLNQNVAVGDRFNVLKKDRAFDFYLLVDISRARMWFYYRNLANGEKVLLKTYSIGVGRRDPRAASGTLTPLGKFQLGSKIIVYRPGARGHFRRKEVEMMSVFGTRWIPLEGIEGPTLDLKGYGIHGTPWIWTGEERREDLSGIGQYSSDGCLRMATCDMEELFAIVITKPTTVEIVSDFCLAEV